MYIFINTRWGINEASRKSGLSVEEITLLYEQSLSRGVLCVFKVNEGYPRTTSGLLEMEECRGA